MYIHCTLIPYIKAAGELKTKPTQHSVKELRSLGIQPDVIVLRTEQPISKEMKEKISLFCDIDLKAVIECKMQTLFQVPISLQEQQLDQLTCDHLSLNCGPANMDEWIQLEKVVNLSKTVRIGLSRKIRGTAGRLYFRCGGAETCWICIMIRILIFNG